MNSEDKLRLQKEYENFSDEGLLEIAGSDESEYQEGVYEIILGEIKKRGLENQLHEENEEKEDQAVARQRDIKLVTVKQFSYRHEAGFAKGILEGQGIEVFMFADDCGGFRPELTFSRGIDLFVKQEDLERAREILEDVEKDI